MSTPPTPREAALPILPFIITLIFIMVESLDFPGKAFLPHLESELSFVWDVKQGELLRIELEVSTKRP